MGNYEYGPEWKIIEWPAEGLPQSIERFLKNYGPSDEQIENLYNNFNLFTESLDPKDETERAIQERVVNRVKDAYTNVPGFKTGRATGFIKRGTVYHNMKSIIENAKGNKKSAIVHKLESLGYNSLLIPQILYGIASIPYIVIVTYGVCGPIDLGRRVIKTPNKTEKISEGIKSLQQKIRNYRERLQEKKQLQKEISERFYGIVDDKI